MTKKTVSYVISPNNLLGFGCLEDALEIIRALKVQKTLIVTDTFLVESGLIKSLFNMLDQAKVFYVLYDQVQPNPTARNVEQGLQVYQSNGCSLIISFGGGSAHDCAKGIALMATHPGSIKDYEGNDRLKNSTAPLITVNTTAGTGSEVTKFCIITDEERKVKMAISDWRLTPILSVNDAALMMNLPPLLTAATGLDAMTHAIESFLSTQSNNLTESWSLEAIRLIKENLPAAVHGKPDAQVREKMAYAAFMAGVAFNNAGLGYAHALAHQLGGFYNLPHGICNAVLLPTIVSFCQPAAPEKFERLALELGVSSGIQVPPFLRDFAKSLGIPSGLRELNGFRQEDIPILAEHAAHDICGMTSPRQATLGELMELLHEAI